MLPDFKMIMHRFDNDIVVYPISDVHLGSAEHMESAWNSFCRKVIERPDVYLILNGDMINNATRSCVSNIFEETMRPREQKQRMVEMLAPLRERILCITPGNHEMRSVKDADDDPTYDIACKLDLEDLYRPNAAFMRINLGSDSKRDGSNRAYTGFNFCVTHGTGGGIYTGASVNRSERFGNIIDGLDCLIVGHTHKGSITYPNKLVIDSRTGQVFSRDVLTVVCTSWMSYGGYALRKMLLPSSVSRPQKIVLHRTEKRIEAIW